MNNIYSDLQKILIAFFILLPYLLFYSKRERSNNNFPDVQKGEIFYPLFLLIFFGYLCGFFYYAPDLPEMQLAISFHTYLIPPALFLVFFVWYLKRRIKLSNIFIYQTKNPIAVQLALFLTMLILIGQLFITKPLLVRTTEYSIYSNSISIFSVSCLLIAALGEELYFRGFLYSIIRKKSNVFYSVIATSLIFTLMHTEFNNYFFVDYIVSGIVYALLFELSGSIFLPICAHFASNFIRMLVHTKQGLEIFSKISMVQLFNSFVIVLLIVIILAILNLSKKTRDVLK